MLGATRYVQDAAEIDSVLRVLEQRAADGGVSDVYWYVDSVGVLSVSYIDASSGSQSISFGTLWDRATVDRLQAIMQQATGTQMDTSNLFHVYPTLDPTQDSQSPSAGSSSGTTSAPATSSMSWWPWLLGATAVVGIIYAVRSTSDDADA